MLKIYVTCLTVCLFACSVLAEHPVSVQADKAPDASLVNTYWKLVELNGRPAPLGSGEREVHMVLEANMKNVHGFSGCNRFAGEFTVKDHALSFPPFAGTMMACEEGMDLEMEFLSTMANVASWSITGERLTLCAVDQSVIATFDSVYLP